LYIYNNNNNIYIQRVEPKIKKKDGGENVSKARKGILGEAVNKLETLSNQMEDVNSGLWTIALELAKLNDQLEAVFEYLKDKGLPMRMK
jgi:hypothetical protein